MITVVASRRRPLLAVYSLLVALAVFAIGELAIRLLVKPTLFGMALGKMELAPKDWNAGRAHMRAVWEERSGDLSYQVYDAQLGWKPGPNRRSADGLYFSSLEGIRAPSPDVSFGDLPPKRLIAVLGDSFAFGERVRYEDAFPAQLEESLGPQYRVLNFGVSGYGVDQSYLRYISDVLSWKPEIVVFSFVWHDLVRTMSVYSFLSFSGWDLPLSKPRLLLTSAGLQQINVPTLSPEEMFRKTRVSDLPFLEHTLGYYPLDWKETVSYFPHLIRFIVPRFVHRLARNQNATKEAIFSVNEAILGAFVKKAKKTGSTPIVVYLPGRSSLGESDARRTLGREFLQESNLEHLDPTSCLLAVNPAERFVPDDPHYAPKGNAAVAKCIGPHIRNALEQRASMAGES
ncbi:MAG: SGNH/GDSL hydrolase family protein [Gammaproteobacteria bacterium]